MVAVSLAVGREAVGMAVVGGRRANTVVREGGREGGGWEGGWEGPRQL
jgi:hypothetical protein